MGQQAIWGDKLLSSPVPMIATGIDVVNKNSSRAPTFPGKNQR